MIETVSEEDRAMPEESSDPEIKVDSRLSNSSTSFNALADDDDSDDDDRVLFNADIVCSAHGEKLTESSLHLCRCVDFLV